MGTTIAIVVVLVLAGLVLLLLEILTPTFGVLAVGALGCFIGAVWLAFDSLSTTAGVGLIMGLGIVVPIYLVVLVKTLPKLPIGGKIFLGQASAGVGDGTPRARDYSGLVGKEGTTLTPLRPSGTVRIDGRRYDASAEGGMIQSGAAVRVIRAGGMNVVVRKVEP